MIGIDLVYLPRIRLDQESFLHHVLSEDERKEYEQLSSERRKREYIGGRFAAKEAFFKATGDPGYLSVSVLHDAKGRPYIKDHEELEVSISHDGDYAAAVVAGR